jgi:hypothetical protein
LHVDALEISKVVDLAEIGFPTPAAATIVAHFHGPEAGAQLVPEGGPVLSSA